MDSTKEKSTYIQIPKFWVTENIFNEHDGEKKRE